MQSLSERPRAPLPVSSEPNNYFRPVCERSWDVFTFDDSDPVATKVAYEQACMRYRGHPFVVYAYREPRTPGPWSGHVRIVGSGRPVPAQWLE